MRNIVKFALAGAAATALAGTAYAAGKTTHDMNVPLPDGSVAHIQYTGDVAPKVTISPRIYAGMPGGMWAPMAMPFPDIGQMMQRMDRETQAMLRQSQQMAHIGAPGVNMASYGNMPAGANSVTVVSYSNGGQTCTRTTEVSSQGAGKAPKVTSNVSGDCAAPTRPQSRPTAATGDPAKPINNT